VKSIPKSIPHAAIALAIVLLRGSITFLPAQSYSGLALINGPNYSTQQTGPAIATAQPPVAYYANTTLSAGSNVRAGSWTAQLEWTTDGVTYSPDFMTGGNKASMMTSWSISTPVPEITPITWDAQNSTRTLQNVPLQHLILYDDYGNYLGINPAPPHYTSANRYGSASVQVQFQNIPTAFGPVSAMTTDGGYAGGGVTIDLASLAGNVPATGGDYTFTCVAAPGGSVNYLFGNSNSGGAVPVLGGRSSQIPIAACPPPTMSASFSIPNFSTNAPGQFFDWSSPSVNVSINSLYPANWTYVELDGPGGYKAYLYNSTPGASGTLNSSTTPLQANEPGFQPSSLAGASDPRAMTFVINLRDVIQRLGNPPAGLYSCTVVTYTPCHYDPASRTGGWGEDTIVAAAGASTPLFYYNPSVNVHSSTTTN
jgi:hypothetical protein